MSLSYETIIEHNEKLSLSKQVNYINILSLKYTLWGIPHRRGNPAFIIYHENGIIAREEYYLNGKLHNESGPAVIYYNEQGEITEKYYFINDSNITDDLQIMIIEGNKLHGESYET